MSLKSRLERLRGVGTAAPAVALELDEIDSADVDGSAALGTLPPEARANRLAELRRRLSDLENGVRRRERRQKTKPIHTGPTPTAARDTPFGRLHARQECYPRHHRHGTAPIGTCAGLAGELLGKLALDQALSGIDAKKLLFFDTETTGLAGGAGTLPFLVGLAWLDDEGMQVEQLLLPEPGMELPILAHLGERLRAASALVTFNGKSFDWPLVHTRYVMNRLTPPTPLPHVDLLHCARRVFKFRLQEMRLQHLEREVLGLERQGDIAGADIPASYFAFLRGAPESSLTPVFEHNAQDLLALAALLGWVGERFAEAGADDDPRDRLGMAHVAARAGDHVRAVDFATLAAAQDRSGRTGPQALTLAGDVLRRQGEFVRAAELYERAAAEVGPGSWLWAELSHKLAILYDRRLADAARALPHARNTALIEGQEAQARRVARLEKKLSR